MVANIKMSIASRLSLAIALILFSFSFPALADTRNELIYRANLGRAADIKLLLSQGASANEKNDDGVPVLALASARKDDEGINVVKMLVSNGADVNATDKMKQTPLFYAAKMGNKDVVQYLLEQKTNYYAADANGDVARTIAYRANHPEIVTQMDNFVKGESAKVAQQYEDLNKKMQQQSAEEKATQAAQAAAAEAAKQKELTPEEKEAEAQKAAEAAKQAEEESKKAEAERQKKLDQMQQAVRELSFQNCAYQYWYYCQSTKQTTELGEEKLAKTIDDYKTKIKATGDTITNNYTVKPNYIDHISQPSKQQIFDEINVMPSKTYRHENGVGTNADMEKRCNLIAAQWDVGKKGETVTPITNGKQPARETGGGGGGIGKASGGRGGEAKMRAGGAATAGAAPEAKAAKSKLPQKPKSHRQYHRQRDNQNTSGSNGGTASPAPSQDQ